MIEDHNEIREDLETWLEAALAPSYPFAFMLSFDDKEASSLIAEAINLFFLRLETFKDLNRFRTKVLFFQCVYRSFVARKQGFWKAKEHNFQRSTLLVQIDPDIRAMLFCKQRLSFDYEDIGLIFEKDRHQVMNDIVVFREKLLGDLRESSLENR
jgi:hypothetical protein